MLERIPGRSLLPPLIKTAAGELPWLEVAHLDLPDGEGEPAARVLRELAVVPGEREVAYRGGRRLVARLGRLDPRRAGRRESPFRQGGRYLLSGGAGGLGAEVARHLLTAYGAELLLVGRSPSPGQEARGRLGATGRWTYEPLDVADGAALEAAVGRAEARWGAPLDGAIHLAGTYGERSLLEETPESFAAALAPKMEGGWQLAELMRRRPGGIFVSFSSVNAFFGGFRVGAYAAANGFLEGLAHVQRQEGAVRPFCLGWSLWDERGISRGRGLAPAAAARGFRAISPRQGIDSLEVALGLGEPAVLIGLAPDHPNVRRYLDEPGRRAQAAEVFVTLSGEPSAAALAGALRDPFGTPAGSEIHRLAEMPLAGGQPDRQKLLLLEQRAAGEPVAPRNETERRLLALWQQVLEAPRLGVQDNFFRFGGHSLLAVRLLARIQEEMGVEIPLSALFTTPTVERMAELLAGGDEAPAGWSVAWSAVVPIQPNGDRPPFFCVAPVLGTVFPYYELARHLGDDQPFYGLQPPSLAADGPSPGDIEGLATFFLEAVRQIQPRGPYHLGGWSFGTLVAYEMARQLEARGEKVALVALLDAPAPGYGRRMTLGQIVHTFYGVVLKNLWPYVRDYFYLRDVSGERDRSRSRLGALLGRLLSLRSLIQGAGIAAAVPPESRLVMLHPPQIRAMLKALKANGRAMSRYTPAPYPGRAVLLRTAEDQGPGGDPAQGWGELARGGVEVREVPGNHMTLLREPHVRGLAAALRDSLERAGSSRI